MGSEVANDQKFVVRKVSSARDDATILRALIQELADFQKMPDGPKISVDQLANDLKNEAANALLAFTKYGEVAGYAIYFICPSSQFGKVFFLEDIYIRPQFRRRKLGHQFMREFAKIAHSLHCSLMMWDVLESNKPAISFYQSLGAQDLTTDPKNNPNNGKAMDNRQILWRIERDQFNKLVERGSKLDLRITVWEDINDASEKSQLISEFMCEQFARYWHQLGDNSYHNGLDAEKLAEFLQTGRLGVVAAFEQQHNDVIGYGSPPVAMALFHRRVYSTWLGPCLHTDGIRVRADRRRRGIGTRMVAEIARFAKASNQHRIGWIASDEPLAQAFSESLGAINITEREGWLLYKWDHEQWLL